MRYFQVTVLVTWSQEFVVPDNFNIYIIYEGLLKDNAFKTD